MRIPLYAGVKAEDFCCRRLEFNAGLWYDKFFCYWAINGNRWVVEEPKSKEEEGGKIKWIKAACGLPVGDGALLREVAQRTAGLVLALGGEVRCFATAWRFVTGLGRAHPVENGFAWHHTLGVPYLPGSSVKGMVRAWMESWSSSLSPADVRRIFGPGEKEKEQEKHVGSVIFFDALPVKPVKLEAEVMTPHYASYYQQAAPEKPPGDWEDPVPIPFLTVARDQIFLFALAPRRPGEEQSRRDCARVAELLTEALAGIGAGAKTAVGYGRFVRREDVEAIFRRLQDESERASSTQANEVPLTRSLSPLVEEMEADGYSCDPEQFMSALTTKWLRKLQDEGTPPEEKREIAYLLKEWYLRYRADQWRKPNKKNAAKIAEIKMYLEVD